VFADVDFADLTLKTPDRRIGVAENPTRARRPPGYEFASIDVSIPTSDSARCRRMAFSAFAALLAWRTASKSPWVRAMLAGASSTPGHCAKLSGGVDEGPVELQVKLDELGAVAGCCRCKLCRQSRRGVKGSPLTDHQTDRLCLKRRTKSEDVLDVGGGQPRNEYSSIRLVPEEALMDKGLECRAKRIAAYSEAPGKLDLAERMIRRERSFEDTASNGIRDGVHRRDASNGLGQGLVVHVTSPA
jgi:hypothetical protein